MKKKLFFLWALLLSVIGTNAQTWTWTGETPSSGNSYYLFADLNDGVARFLNNTTNSFDSEPTVQWTVSGTFPSSYSLSSTNGKFAITKSWTTTSVSTSSNASGDDINLTSSGSGGVYEIHRAKTFTTGGNRNIQVTSSGIATASNATSCWKFISQDQVAAYNRYQSFVANKASASYANPVDATFLINPGFEGGTSGWVNNGTAKLGTQTNNAESIMVGSKFAEKWAAEGSIDFYQTLIAMPAGKYRISVRGVDKAPTKAIFYANSQEVSFGSDVKRMYIDLTLGAEQDIKIGVKHSSHPANTWLGIEEFVVTYYGNDDYSSATEDNPKDVTGWIFNNSFERGNNDGWTHLGGGGAMAIQNNTDFGKNGTYYLESWQPGYNKGVEQTLENLPAGVYKVSLTAKARGVKNAKLYIGDNETPIDVADVVKEYTVEGTCFEGSIKIGFYSEVANGAPVNGSWMAIDNFRLSFYESAEGSDEVSDGVHYYFGTFATAPTVELTDEVPIADLSGANINGTVHVTATNPNGLVFVKSGQAISGVTNNIVSNGTCANLVLTDGGTFKAHKNFEATSASYNMTAVAGDKFGTLMLPFSVSSLPGKAYTLDQGVSFGEEIHATEANAIVANTPVLVTKAGDYTASSVAVAATNDTHTNGELVGTYKATPAIVNTYVLQNHSGRVAFFMVNTAGVTTVNPFRAYIKSQAAGARDFLNVVFDDETGLDMVNESTSQLGNQIYDLAGRRVNNAVKGIYIINGKKVIK